MTNRRCFRLCGLKLRKQPVSSARSKAGNDDTDEEGDFSPACTCQAFRQTGTCKHLPPTVMLGTAAGGGTCNCQAFKTNGTCKHLPPPGLLVAGPPIRQCDSQANCSSEDRVAAGGATARPGLCVSTAVELPDLGLQPMDFALQLRSIIGRGASGATVLRGSIVRTAQADIQVPCAAKVLPLGRGTWPDMVEDFGREIEIMKGLQHPALVAFLGAGQVQSPPELARGDCSAYVLCLELCDLALETAVVQRRQDGNPFSSDELGPALAQVSAGLSYLHQNTVLHRDLKSANVFLRCKEVVDDNVDLAPALPLRKLNTFHVQLGDLGSSAKASRAQTPVQTPQWMAPEVIRCEGYGPPADVWAVGMLMYELLELDVPYGEHITMPQLEEQLKAGRAPSLTEEKAVEARTPKIVDLMRRCAEAEPEARPTAAELCSLVAAAGWPYEEVIEWLSV